MDAKENIGWLRNYNKGSALQRIERCDQSMQSLLDNTFAFCNVLEAIRTGCMNTESESLLKLVVARHIAAVATETEISNDNPKS
jgi:hypothetical protein